MKKILYITTVSRTINAFLVPHINMLIDKGYKVDCACSIDHELDTTIRNRCENIFNIPFSRNPLNPNNLKAYKMLLDIQKEHNYDMVHVHTPVASIYGRLLKLKFPDIKTIYTVHGFHFFKGSSKINWLVYYPIEKIMSKFTDIIITMNEEDYRRSLNFKVDKVYKFNGVGLDLDSYKLNENDMIRVRRELNLNHDDFVICMIAEVNKNKNHKQIIDAIEVLKNRNINVKLICAGDGILYEATKEYIKSRNLQDNIHMLGFRTDINRLISSCNIGVLMSYREGLPRNIMELMACKKPVIGTNIRGIRDLIKDGKTGYLVDVGDVKSTADKIEILYKNKDYLNELSKNCYRYIQKYDVSEILEELKEVYI
ncbi:MAG: glycosyltransferase family 4 protein [Peptostreptococcaceae bacterium]|nr:glycosyltransferase family 4 protein [Peptostreptococcaceae bacterium]